MQYFNIQIASQLSGVASATIRVWERRYKAVVPQRGENKHRLYSEKDIEKLTLLSCLTELGETIRKIAPLSIDELQKIYRTLKNEPFNKKELVKIYESEVIDYQKILAQFYISLAAYKIDILSHELEKTRTMLSPKDLCLNILVPLFHEIGHKVNRGELSIAQEHTLSAIVSFHIGQVIAQHYQKSLVKNDLILISTPEGEMHEIGIMASALLCVHHGIRFIFLGPNLPAQSISEAANALGAKAILLGVTKGHEISEQKNLEDYLSELISLNQVGAQIWVGGNLKPYVRSELEKRRILFFPTLEKLNEHLNSWS